MGSGLVVISDVSFESSLDVSDTLYVHQESYLDGDVSLGAGLVVIGGVSFESSLDVSGDVSMGAGLVAMGDVSFESSLDVSDNLYVHAKSYLDGDVSMGAGLVVMSDVSFETSLDVSDNLYVHAKSYLDDDVSMGQSLYVVGDVSMGQSLYVVGDVSMGSSLEVSNNAYVNNRLFSYSNSSGNEINVNNETSKYISRLNLYTTDVSSYTLDVSQINGVTVSDISYSIINSTGDLSYNNAFLFDGSYIDYNSVTSLLVGGFGNIYSRLEFVEDVTGTNGSELDNFDVPGDISAGGNIYAMGKMGIGTINTSGGGLHIYETTGSTPEIKDIASIDANGNVTDSNHYEGSLILEHADVSGTSGILFPSSRSSTSTEYGYIQWQDAIGSSSIEDYATLTIGAKEVSGNNLSQIIALMPTKGVGIMKDAPTCALDVSGDISASSTITGYTITDGTSIISGGDIYCDNLDVNTSIEVSGNITTTNGGLVGIGTEDPSGGGLHIYETTGSSPEITLVTSIDDNGNSTVSNHYGGSLILEHVNVNGTSGILFPSSRSSTSTEYGYIQWQDAIGSSSIDDYAKLIIGAKEASGNDLSQIIALMPTNGVGVMKDAPTCALDVSGTFQATGNTTIGGTLDVSGATTLTGVLTANGRISGNVTGDLSGNATTATTLETWRNIGGVSFNGSDDINLPGVDIAGNQDTSGNAATATQVYVTSGSTTDTTYYYLPFVTGDTSANKALNMNTSLYYYGTSLTAPSFTANSDIKLKENIVALDDPLEKVLRLQGAEFNWKNDETKRKTVGFIAQEVEEVIPELVHIGNDEIRSLNYNGVVPYLVESIKIQQQEIANQKQEITNQKQEIANQKQEIANQQTQINMLLERLTSLESKMT